MVTTQTIGSHKSTISRYQKRSFGWRDYRPRLSNFTGIYMIPHYCYHFSLFAYQKSGRMT
jgi:hypothetical protein